MYFSTILLVFFIFTGCEFSKTGKSQYPSTSKREQPNSRDENNDVVMAAPIKAEYSHKLSIEEIEETLKNGTVDSIESFLERLPETFKGNYVLMRKSKSRHRSATVENPRIIIFGHDANLLIGIATNPADKNYNDLEVIQLRPDGSWDFRVADMAAVQPTLGKTNNKSCQGCHGNPARPIWGSYPDWEGAFHDSIPGKHELSKDEFETAEKAIANPEDYPRLSKLPLRFHGNGLEAPKTRFNEHVSVIFNMDLGSRLAESLFHRLTKNEIFPLYKFDFLFLESCGEYYDENGSLRSEFHPRYTTVKNNIDQLYSSVKKPEGHDINAYYKGGYRNRLFWSLGFDPRNEFGISKRIFEVSWDDRDLNSQDWFEGEATLALKVAFLTLGDVLMTDDKFRSGLPQHLVTRQKTLLLHHFANRGLDRIQDFDFLKVWSNRHYYSYFSDFFDELRENSNYCQLLADRIQSR